MSLTCVAAVSPDEDVPAVLVSVSSSPSVTDLLTVWRIHEDDSVHQVLTSDHNTLIGSWSGIDYHCPFDQNVRYYAEAGGLTSSTSPALWMPSNGQTWLIHPTDPALSVQVEMLTAVGDFSYSTPAARSKVLNSKLPRHRSNGPREGEKGSITVLCTSLDSRQAMTDLLADGDQILVNTPFDDSDLGWKWVQPDTVTRSNRSERRRFAAREVSFGYEETTQPDADVRIWTIAEFMAAWPVGGVAGADPDTIGNANSHYANLTAVKLDVRS